ncbi:hypothetical protein KUCAC02_036380 [Chaenocephalus aceratus]|nr:hypothetical protein KUCAC02_036380 [Chaenocephalus aceratus]
MKKLLMAVDTLSPSNADCERGFSTMNNIITEYRSNPTTTCSKSPLHQLCGTTMQTVGSTLHQLCGTTMQTVGSTLHQLCGTTMQTVGSTLHQLCGTTMQTVRSTLHQLCGTTMQTVGSTLHQLCGTTMQTVGSTALCEDLAGQRKKSSPLNKLHGSPVHRRGELLQPSVENVEKCVVYLPQHALLMVC